MYGTLGAVIVATQLYVLENNLARQQLIGSSSTPNWNQLTDMYVTSAEHDECLKRVCNLPALVVDTSLKVLAGDNEKPEVLIGPAERIEPEQIDAFVEFIAPPERNKTPAFVCNLCFKAQGGNNWICRDVGYHNAVLELKRKKMINELDG